MGGDAGRVLACGVNTVSEESTEKLFRARLMSLSFGVPPDQGSQSGFHGTRGTVQSPVMWSFHCVWWLGTELALPEGLTLD